MRDDPHSAPSPSSRRTESGAFSYRGPDAVRQVAPEEWAARVVRDLHLHSEIPPAYIEDVEKAIAAAIRGAVQWDRKHFRLYLPEMAKKTYTVAPFVLT